MLLELKRYPSINRTEHGVDFLGCRLYRNHIALRAYPKRGLTLWGFRVDIETDGISTSFGDDEFVPREGRTPFRIGSESVPSGNIDVAANCGGYPVSVPQGDAVLADFGPGVQHATLPID